MPGVALPRGKQVFLTGLFVHGYAGIIAEIRRETGRRRLKAARRGTVPEAREKG